MDPVLHVVGNVLYYSFDAAGKVTKDFDGASNIAKIVGIGIQYLNMDLKNSERVLQPLFRSIKIVTDCSSIRNWASKVVLFLSGEAAGIDEATQIFIAPGVTIPNILKISSISCLLASDILGSLKWLDNLEIISLAKFTETIGNVPVLGGFLAGIAIQEVIGTFVVVGILFDLGDTVRDIYQNKLTWYNGALLASDIAKLTGIVLATASGQFLVIGLVANGTACICTLARFVMKSYGIGGVPVRASSARSAAAGSGPTGSAPVSSSPATTSARTSSAPAGSAPTGTAPASSSPTAGAATGSVPASSSPVRRSSTRRRSIDSTPASSAQANSAPARRFSTRRSSIGSASASNAPIGGAPLQ